ncbi:midcut-by-XrtH protein [Gilvimarinus sp. 1_MG-2023]|uniref:midcut-by-XrtH protein n=1 Tax=Gilvimarinus sp. 1_MG-2023 TaxID=3062638 RepID=UPI0026E2F3E5|nr:midcut-by-XrtH protein [Gilvimarinus sp. 1_MG-2023]MDO6747732.1 midcut-by-XrtH protein [Gilvimarinus sp. 1_MG-2023]
MKATIRAFGGFTLLAGLLHTSNLYAQGVGTGSLNASALPVNGTVAIVATVLGLIAIGYWALSKKPNLLAALAGPALLIGVGGALIASPELRANLPPNFYEFTNPAGEYIDASAEFDDGYTSFSFYNASGVDLKVTQIDDPDLTGPFCQPVKPSVKSTEAVLEAAPAGTACTAGSVLAAGETCVLDYSDICDGH